MADKLSDRIFNSSADIFENIFQSEIVQKFFMTGQLTDRNRNAAVNGYKNLSDMKETTFTIFKEILKLPGLTNEEKAFFEKIDLEFEQSYGKMLADYEQAIGPIPSQLLESPMRTECQQYVQLLKDAVAKGTVVDILVTFMFGYSVLSKIYNYLENSPTYKENDITNLLVFRTFGGEIALKAFKDLIDNRADEVGLEAEAHLKATYRLFAENWLNNANSLFE